MKKNTRKWLKSPDMLALQRQQLDRRLAHFTESVAPSVGWIRTIREALGMTPVQLARRLRISPQAVRSLEAREQKGTITLEKLRQALDAMHCELRTVCVPRTSLEAIVLDQAALKAREQRNRIMHTMNLEAQGAGVSEVLDEQRAREAWLTQLSRKLWD